MNEFDTEVQLRRTRNLAKLRRMQAEVRQIATTLSRVSSSMEDTNQLLQSLPLYRAQLAREARARSPSQEDSSAAAPPVLRLVVSDA